MDESLIRKQSESAYNQWCVQWREHAKINSKYEQKSLYDFENIGVGKAVLCVANGYSFEENIDLIIKYKDKIDIFACDKTLGALLDHGIKPKYLMVCDANVNYEKYMEPWKDQLQDTILIMNVCGQPKWAENGNWKDKYFFINKDILNSELEFSKISGCQNFIPAGTNVSNAMVIMLTQSDNGGRRNHFGYDKILLIGFDYSWRYNGKYYAFSKDGEGKDQYMRHLYLNTVKGDPCYTSGNLAFSAQWFETYVKTFNLPVLVCSDQTILHNLKTVKLEDHIGYEYKPIDSRKLQVAVNSLRFLKHKEQELTKIIKGIEKDHWQSFVCSV